MGDYIEIEITINSLLISDLHETITSIIEQVDRERLDFHVMLINLTNIDTTEEQKRLSAHNIKVIHEHSNARFVLRINSGEIASQSFLYKGVHFLKNNSASFVCPEYTFRRIENTLVITTIINDQMLYNKTSSNLLDKEKFANHQSLSLRASIIKDTCLASPTTNDDYYEHIYKTKKQLPEFVYSPFSLSDIKNTKKNKLFDTNSHLKTFKHKIKSNLTAITGRSRIAKKILSVNSHSTEPVTIHSNIPPYISNTMRNELHQLSTIKYGLKGYESMRFIDITYEAFAKNESLFESLQIASEKLDHNNYSYFMILPWLISGGIDLFAINYLRSLSELMPNKNILVFLTNGAHESFTKEELNLPANISFVNLPILFKHITNQQTLFPQIIYAFVNMFTPERIHVIASKAGYDCLEKYGEAIRKKGISIIFSSYNYLVGPHGEYMGYTVQELPMTYRIGDIITTDNKASKDLWVNHFGFIAKDILIHNQLFECQTNNEPKPTSKDGIKILWAAHVRPEKNPEILPLIAEELKKDKIQIDCYGLFSPMNWPDGNNPLETSLSNLHYKGPYKDFFNDIDLTQYDLFLYTSHSDGTPNVIIEAALAGLPIVTSNIGGISEALEGKATLVSDTYSKEEFINAIKDNLSNKTKSTKKAHELQQKLQQKHNKKQFTKQIEEMLDRSKK